MRYCVKEQRDFPESEFETDADGVWHVKRGPRHLAYDGSEKFPPPDKWQAPDAEKPGDR